MRRFLPFPAAVAAVLALGLVAPAADVATADPAPAPAAVTAAPSLVGAFTGYRVVKSALISDPIGTRTRGEVSCPAGSHVIGGGAVITRTAIKENLAASYPLPDGQTWRVYVNDNEALSGNFRVYATCVKNVSAYSIVQGDDVANPAGTQHTAEAICPADTSPLGGGGSGTSTSTAVNLNSSFPVSDGWRVDVNNGSAADDLVRAFAVCGAVPTTYRQIAGKRAPIGNGTQGFATATCPGTLTALSGGGLLSSVSTQVALDSTSPSGTTGWSTSGNNASGVKTFVYPYVVCVRTV